MLGRLKNFISKIKFDYDKNITPDGFFLSFEIFGNNFKEWLRKNNQNEVEKVGSQFEDFKIVQSKINISEEMYFETLQIFVDKN